MREMEITKANFETEVVASEAPVLLDFWATWCGPCRMLAPIMAEIAEERNDIKVGKINVDEEGELADAFGISSIPTVIVLKNGKVVASAVGYRPKADILALLS